MGNFNVTIEIIHAPKPINVDDVKTCLVYLKEILINVIINYLVLKL